MPLAAFSLRVTSLFEFRDLHFAHSNFNRLRDCLFFQFFLLRRILVDYTNLSLCGWLNFNPFSRTFVHFIIVALTWHDFTSYSILLPMSISARVFHTLNICFRCNIYVTT